jgi:hypothetical protein
MSIGIRRLLTALGLCGLAICPLDAVRPPVRHQLYEGPARPEAEIARLHVPATLEVRAVDERGLATPLHGVLELLPGKHRLRANPTIAPSEGFRFYLTNAVEFEAAAGAAYRLEEDSFDRWAPRVVVADRPLPSTGERSTGHCWLASVDGVVVATEIRGLKVKRVTLRVDGDEAPRTWDYRAPALVPPGGLLKSMAGGWSRDGALWGYDKGARAALQPGQRLRALYSECEPELLVEFQLPAGEPRSP